MEMEETELKRQLLEFLRIRNDKVKSKNSECPEPTPITRTSLFKGVRRNVTNDSIDWKEFAPDSCTWTIPSFLNETSTSLPKPRMEFPGDCDVTSIFDEKNRFGHPEPEKVAFNSVGILDEGLLEGNNKMFDCGDESVSSILVFDEDDFISEMRNGVMILRSRLGFGPFVKVSKRFFLEDVQTMLFGFPSNTFKIDGATEKFKFRSPITIDEDITPETLEDFMSPFFHCGTSFRQLTRALDAIPAVQPSIVREEFSRGLKSFLTLYRYKICDKSLANFDTIDVSLIRMRAFVVDELQPILNLTSALMKIRPNDVQILNVLHAALNKSLNSYGYVYYIFKRCCDAYLRTITEWIFTGNLEDANEWDNFFVAKNPGNVHLKLDGDAAKLRFFSLRRGNCPNFLLHLAEDILICGQNSFMLRHGRKNKKYIPRFSSEARRFVHSNKYSASPTTNPSAEFGGGIYAKAENDDDGWKRRVSFSTSNNSYSPFLCRVDEYDPASGMTANFDGGASERRLKEFLGDLVRGRLIASNKDLVAYVMKESKFERELASLRDYFTFQNGDFSRHLLKAVLRERRFDPFLRCESLDRALALACKAVVSSVDASKCFTRTLELKKWRNGTGGSTVAETLRELYLNYVPSEPARFFAPSDHSETLAGISNVMMQLRFADFALKEVFAISRKFRFTSRNISYISGMKHFVWHVSNAITGILEDCWKRNWLEISDWENGDVSADKILQTQYQYWRDVSYGCFLFGRGSEFLLNALNSIISFCDFALLERKMDGNDDDNEICRLWDVSSKPARLYGTFLKSWNEFRSVLSANGDVHSKHLANLLQRNDECGAVEGGEEGWNSERKRNAEAGGEKGRK